MEGVQHTGSCSVRARCPFPFQQPVSLPRPHPACLQSHLSPVQSTTLLMPFVPGVGLSQLTALRCTLPTPHVHALPVHSTHTATLSHTQRQPFLHASFDIHSSPSQMHHGVGDTLTRAYTHTHILQSILNSELLLPIPLFLSLSLSLSLSL